MGSEITKTSISSAGKLWTGLLRWVSKFLFLTYCMTSWTHLKWSVEPACFWNLLYQARAHSLAILIPSMTIVWLNSIQLIPIPACSCITTVSKTASLCKVSSTSTLVSDSSLSIGFPLEFGFGSWEEVVDITGFSRLSLISSSAKGISNKSTLNGMRRSTFGSVSISVRIGLMKVHSSSMRCLPQFHEVWRDIFLTPMLPLHAEGLIWLVPLEISFDSHDSAGSFSYWRAWS